MKNKILYITIFVLFFLSCNDDFLSLAPETGLTSGTFFKTAEHFEQAITGAYQPLRTVVNYSITMDEMRSDNTFFSFYPQDRSFFWREAYALFVDDNLGGYTSGRYNNDYVGISRTNTILSRIEEIDFNNAVKDRITGESLFLRAFYYFDLVTHYGGVPLHLDEITNEDEAFLPRSTVNDIYNQIIVDLNNAMPKLPTASNFPQSGRATKGAAKILLAYAYMSKTERDYPKAESELRDLTKMNYSLLENYSDVFSPENENSQESIFEVQYKAGDTGQENNYIWQFTPRVSNSEFLFGITYSTTYTSGWNVPTQEMVDSYEEGDLRLNASIAVVEGVQDEDVMFAEAIEEVVGYTPTEGKIYYYFINKYFHPPYEKEVNTGTNWPVYRYADALLLLAECLVEQNKNTEALPYLNQVRNRAGLPDLQEATRENVAKERRHELAFENHRWLDLIRTGKAIEVMNAFGNRMKSKYEWIIPAAFNVSENRLIYPIPYRELQINELLEQNSGYN